MEDVLSTIYRTNKHMTLVNMNKLMIGIIELEGFIWQKKYYYLGI